MTEPLAQPPAEPVPAVTSTPASGARPDGPPASPDAVPAASPDAGRPRPGQGPPGRPSLGWTELGVVVLAYLVFSVAAFLVTGAPGPDGQNTFPVLLGAVAATLLAVAVALAVRVRSLPAIGLRATTWRWLLVGVGAGVLARVAAFGLVLGYMAVTGDRSNPQDFLVGTAAAGATSLVLLLVVAAGLVPLAEELLFRGVLYGSLRRYGVLAGLVVSALLFGLAHGVTVVLPVAVLLGVLNVLLYERSGSIWPAVVAHAVHNALGFLLAALIVS